MLKFVKNDETYHVYDDDCPEYLDCVFLCPIGSISCKCHEFLTCVGFFYNSSQLNQIIDFMHNMWGRNSAYGLGIDTIKNGRHYVFYCGSQQLGRIYLAAGNKAVFIANNLMYINTSILVQIVKVMESISVNHSWKKVGF